MEDNLGVVQEDIIMIGDSSKTHWRPQGLIGDPLENNMSDWSPKCLIRREIRNARSETNWRQTSMMKHV